MQKIINSDPFINQLKIFVSQEPNVANIKITPSRTKEFIFYLTTLKKMTGNLSAANQNKDIPNENRFSGLAPNRPEQFGNYARRQGEREGSVLDIHDRPDRRCQQSGKPKCDGYMHAYRQYYLGELYAKCPYTFLAYKKSRSLDQCVDENKWHLLRMKAAVIHYLNALVEANKNHDNKKNRNLIINCLRHLKILPSLPLDNRLKIIKQTILTLTELLNQQPIIAIAIDDLYDKAKFALEDYIILAKKEFLGRFNGDKEIEAMLIKYYRNTIFEKMAVNVTNEVNRLNSKRHN